MSEAQNEQCEWNFVKLSVLVAPKAMFSYKVYESTDKIVYVDVSWKLPIFVTCWKMPSLQAICTLPAPNAALTLRFAENMQDVSSAAPATRNTSHLLKKRKKQKKNTFHAERLMIGNEIDCGLTCRPYLPSKMIIDIWTRQISLILHDSYYYSVPMGTNRDERSRMNPQYLAIFNP